MGQTPCLPCQGPRGKHVLCHSQQSPALSDIIQHPINYPCPPPPSSSPHIGLHYKVHLVTYSITRANPARTHTHTDVTLISDKRGDTRLPPAHSSPSLSFPPSPHMQVSLSSLPCAETFTVTLYYFFFPSSELDVTKRSARI